MVGLSFGSQMRRRRCDDGDRLSAHVSRSESEQSPDRSSTASAASASAPASSAGHGQRRSRRPQRRQLFCPAHPEQRIEGNGRKYFLHLLTPEELKARGMSHRRAQLVIDAYPVLVLSNEWLEELFCPKCGSSRWCHITQQERHLHTVRWAPPELWQQVAHVDPLVPNPSVSQFTRRAARRANINRADGKGLFDPG